jgi:2-polyprenyl-3-methyl-5-hydroxy-6-metoxy-1,4-benzoquinol methylase
VIGWLKKAYRRFVPMPIRQSRAMEWPKNVLLRLLPHDAVYDADYYANAVEDGAAASAEIMAAAIRREFAPRSVIDVGCGTGALLEAMRTGGVRILGLEYSTAALKRCRARGIDVVRVDLRRETVSITETFDVAVSVEVAEHLPAAAADRYVDLLTRLSNLVVFTAAPPGQGGTDHVNEQPQDYWIAKFGARSFRHVEDLSAQWRQAWKAGGVAGWYCNNVMVFKKRTD